MILNIKLGDIITFRYSNPKKKENFRLPKNVLVISPNFNGHLHGVKIEGLTPTEQEYIQRLLEVAYNNPQNIFAPMEAQIQQRKKELDMLNQQRNELIKSSQRVIIQPVSQEPPALTPADQAKQRVKQILGSVIGRVSTFGRTNIQPQQPTNIADIQHQIQNNDYRIEVKKKELDQFVELLKKNQADLSRMPSIPKDPYNFYHSFFKNFIGNTGRMKTIYRKYNISQIQTPRIIKSIGIIPNVQR